MNEDHLIVYERGQVNMIGVGLGAESDRVPAGGVRAWHPPRHPAGRAGLLRLPRRA